MVLNVSETKYRSKNIFRNDYFLEILYCGKIKQYDELLLNIARKAFPLLYYEHCSDLILKFLLNLDKM